ncbi:hypothetical protein GQS40_08230|uniref:peptide-methionine (S)-S-oxide reductase n=1 Tax=Leuconostoc lactis TaxID=1246 RepID=A0A6L7AAG6_LEULA|nr:hypothetical protein [Leuconostoc lactis]
MTKTTETAIFAGGCFWCMVQPFDSLPGIEKVRSGYTGGHTENPTYEEQDIQNGKRTEIDFLNGYFARLGQQEGIPTPFNALVTRLIHAKEDIVRTKLAKEKENFEI